MKSLTLLRLSFSVGLILCLGLAACSDNKPDAENPQMPTARTEPLPFRMTQSGEAPKLPAPSGEVSSDSLPPRAPDGQPALFAVESGHLTMRYAGDRQGIKEIFFKDYGRYRRTIDSSGPTKAQDPVPMQDVLDIHTPQFIGVYQYEQGQGWRAPNREPEMMKGLSPTMSMSEFMLTKSGGKRLPDTTINGYHTRVYRIDQKVIVHTIWLWRGIAIREHFFAPYDNIEYWIEPVNLVLGGVYNDSLFAYSKDLVIIDRSAPPIPSALPPPPIEGQSPNQGKAPQGTPQGMQQGMPPLDPGPQDKPAGKKEK